MFRIVFLAFAFLALLSPVLSKLDCPSVSDYKMIFKKNDKGVIDKFKNAKTAKQCDNAFVYFMKNNMHGINSENAGIYVHHGLGAAKSLVENKGNLKNTIKAFMKECSGDLNKAFKELGYPKAEETTAYACAMKHRSFEDWDGTIKYVLDYAKKVISDPAKAALVLQAALKEELFKPFADQIGAALG